MREEETDLRAAKWIEEMIRERCSVGGEGCEYSPSME